VADLKARKIFAIIFAAALVVQPQRLAAKNLEKQFKHAAKDFHRGHLEKAERKFAAILAAQPDYPGAKIFLAQTHFLLGLEAAGRGRPPVAVQEIKQALRLDPDEPYWHSTLAVLLQEQGDPIGAEQECEQAGKLSPDDAGLAAGCGLGKAAWPPEKHTKPREAGPRPEIYEVGGEVRSPRILEEPQNQYTDKAKLVGLKGTVVLEVVIGAQGHVEEERVIRPLGLGLDELALRMVRSARYEPARRHGVPVAVRIRINVRFEHLEGEKGRPGKSER
jgi:TonB family protein